MNNTVFRPLNLILVALTQLILYLCLLQPLYTDFQIKLTLEGPLLTLLILTTVIVTFCGYMINDYVDYQVDFEYKNEKKQLPQHYYLALYFGAFLIGLIISYYIAFFINKPFYVLYYLSANALLFLYSTHFKSIPILGNTIVAAFTAFVIAILFAFEIDALNALRTESLSYFNQTILVFLFYSAFSFLLNICREIIKDIEDFEGDLAYNVNTLATKYSKSVAKSWALGTSLAFSAFLMIFFWKYRLEFTNISNVYFITFLLLPSILIIYKLNLASRQEDYRKLSHLYKMLMISGLIFIILYTWI